MIKENIQKLLFQAIQKKGIDEEIILEVPRIKNWGDFSCPIAMKIAKKMRQNPVEIARFIIENIPKNNIIEKIEIAGAGFLNMTLSNEIIAKEILTFDPTKNIINESPRKIELEFGNPNIAKPLHFGHFRGLIIGESLSRILRFSGHDILTDNFIGDWGTQFGKLIVAIRKWGNRKDIEKNPTKEFVQLYQKFHSEITPELEKEGAEEFRKMEVDRDEDNFKIWEWIVQESMKDFYHVADQLDVHYDVIRGESFYERMLPEILQKLEDTEVAIREKEGTLVVRFPEETKLPNMIFQKTDGATLYQTRDLAKIVFYEKERFHELIYVVGSDQSLHLRQVFRTARMLGFTGKYTHVQHGMVRLPEGKMSTRKGRVIGLQEVLAEAKQRVFDMLSKQNKTFPKEERENLSEIIAIGALKFNDLSQNRKTDITFDWEKMLSFEGFSAPFLQYSAVRCMSILKKEKGNTTPNEEMSFSYPQERTLATKILSFPNTVLESARTLEPHHLAKYLFELAGDFNKFYANCPVLRANDAIKKHRLLLTKKTGETLQQGLYLLGIQTPEKM
jgi:arginyl-tRNA synthetase